MAILSDILFSALTFFGVFGVLGLALILLPANMRLSGTIIDVVKAVLPSSTPKSKKVTLPPLLALPDHIRYKIY